jgi:hypothetical protein
MENLISDNSFEVYHNSEGAKILGWDRTLMQYPDEKNSFDVFLGFTDENKDGKDDKSGKTQEQIAEEKAKAKADREAKLTQLASIGKDAIQTGQAVAGAVKSFQTKSKQDVKAVCGRKPLRKKNRPPYDKCVANYMASLNTGGDTDGGDTGGTKSTEADEDKPKKNNTTTYVVIAVVGLALIGGLIYLKKTGKI